jgi:uncharacterized membrane protein
MESYKLLVFLHIVAVIVALGATFALPFLQAFAERQGVAATRMFLRFSLRMDTILVTPGAVLIALLGVGLIFDDHTGYKDDFPMWLGWAILWFVAAVAVDWLVMRPLTRSGIGALEGVPDGPDLPAAYEPLGKRGQMIGGLLGLSVIGIAFLMVWKPGE